jgi:hypothetical protein
MTSLPPSPHTAHTHRKARACCMLSTGQVACSTTAHCLSVDKQKAHAPESSASPSTPISVQQRAEALHHLLAVNSQSVIGRMRKHCLPCVYQHCTPTLLPKTSHLLVLDVRLIKSAHFSSMERLQYKYNKAQPGTHARQGPGATLGSGQQPASAAIASALPLPLAGCQERDTS